MPATPRNLTLLEGLDPQAAAFVNETELKLAADPNARYRDIASGRGYAWTIHTSDEVLPGPVGFATLWFPPGRLATMGAIIHRDKALGLGLGSSSFVAMADFAFGRAGAEVVTASTAAVNRRCIRALGRIGCVPLDSEDSAKRWTKYGPKGLSTTITNWIVYHPNGATRNLRHLPVQPSAVTTSRRNYRTVRAEYRIQTR